MRKWVYSILVGLAASAVGASTLGLSALISSAADEDSGPAPRPAPRIVRDPQPGRPGAHITAVGAALVLGLLLAACASGTKASVALNGRILHAADLPDMRLHQPAQVIPVAAAFAGALSDGNVVIFKEPQKAIPVLQRDGFIRAVAEDFTGPGTFAGAMAAEFSSPAKATAGLTDIYNDALQPCPNDPVCSIQHVFTVSGIPGSKGEELIPYRKFGRGFTQWRVLFQIGSIVYGVAIGGFPESFDPGTISRADAYKTFRALYARVKKGPSSGLFAPTPMPS